MLYVKVEKNEVMNINDNKLDDYIEIDVNDIDSAIDFMLKQNWTFDENILQLLENMFSDISENVLNIYDIKVSTENRSFNELADMFQEKEIEIPDMQRNFVWDTQKCSKLIESILIGLPIPPLFFMDKGNNQYEVIDGLQRLTAISNYILGNTWGNITNDIQRNTTAKLSRNVDPAIAGKKFEELHTDLQKKLKRSTVTVIDFRQIGSEDEKAKYLIFERINTGSELLNPMQIRKALAYGPFMNSIYQSANKSEVLKSIFGKPYLNKDKHVEFMLGVYVTYQVLNNEYTLTSQYQKYILNDFCESNKNNNIDPNFVEVFDEKLEKLLKLFNDKDIFKKVNTDGKYHGNRNNNISEILMATAIKNDYNLESEKIIGQYKKLISNNIDKFSINTMNRELILQRNGICEKILNINE